MNLEVVEVKLTKKWQKSKENSGFYSYNILTTTDYKKNSWKEGDYNQDGAGIWFALGSKEIKKLDFENYNIYARYKTEDVIGEGCKYCCIYTLIACSKTDENDIKIILEHKLKSKANYDKIKSVGLKAQSIL